MSEEQLRAVMLHADNEVALVCAEVLDILELRDQGQELLQFNLVDVTVDCDQQRVTIEPFVVSDDLPPITMSVEQFVEIATPLAAPRSPEERALSRRQREKRLRARPMPGPQSP